MRRILLLLLTPILAIAQVTVVQSPAPKFRDFTAAGVPNASGCVYTFASGTSTPQATYTDSTGLFQNTNPVQLDSNGEAQIFVTANVYRFQVWTFGSGALGSNCGNGTLRYQIDGVNPSSPLTTFNPLISTGNVILQQPTAASSGQNQSSNLLQIQANYWNGSTTATDTWSLSDVLGNGVNPTSTLTFNHSGTPGGALIALNNSVSLGNNSFTVQNLIVTGNTLKLTEGAAPASVSGSDILEADSTAHRFEQCSNGVACAQLVNAGVDVNTSDQVTQLHFGATATPLSGTAPTTGQFLQWNGTNIIGATAATTIQTTSDQSLSTSTLTNVSGMSFSVAANTNYRFRCVLNGVGTATSGLNIAFTGPAAPTALFYGFVSQSTPATSFGGAINLVPSGVTTQTVGDISGALLNGANSGTVQMQQADTTNGQTVTLKAGSYCIIQ